jgi:hypothetical protein
MTTTDLPASGADQPLDEAACRRLMVSLFGEKAAALGTLLLRSADSAKSEPKRALHAQFDAAEFSAFMNAVNRRANALQDRGAAQPAELAPSKPEPNGTARVASIGAITRRAHQRFFPIALAAAKFDRFASLRSNWRAWALAAAAVLVIVIGSGLLYRAHLDSSNVAVIPSSSFELAGESKPVPAPTPTPPQQ